MCWGCSLHCMCSTPRPARAAEVHCCCVLMPTKIPTSVPFWKAVLAVSKKSQQRLPSCAIKAVKGFKLATLVAKAVGCIPPRQIHNVCLQAQRLGMPVKAQQKGGIEVSIAQLKQLKGHPGQEENRCSSKRQAPWASSSCQLGSQTACTIAEQLNLDWRNCAAHSNCIALRT